MAKLGKKKTSGTSQKKKKNRPSKQIPKEDLTRVCLKFQTDEL